MARLPNGNRAILDLRKVEDYCLNPHHPGGRHKARVFRDALGLVRTDAQWLREALLTAASTVDADEVGSDQLGRRWRLDVAVRRQSRQIQSGWYERVRKLPVS